MSSKCCWPVQGPQSSPRQPLDEDGASSDCGGGGGSGVVGAKSPLSLEVCWLL